jgi:hypothetical protein
MLNGFHHGESPKLLPVIHPNFQPYASSQSWPCVDFYTDAFSGDVLGTLSIRVIWSASLVARIGAGRKSHSLLLRCSLIHGKINNG